MEINLAMNVADAYVKSRLGTLIPLNCTGLKQLKDEQCHPCLNIVIPLCHNQAFFTNVICTYYWVSILTSILYYCRWPVQQWWEEVQGIKVCHSKRDTAECRCHLLHLCWYWRSSSFRLPFPTSNYYRLLLSQVNNDSCCAMYPASAVNFIARFLLMCTRRQRNLDVLFLWCLVSSR